MLSYTIIQNEDGSANVALFLDGEVQVAHSTHANYKAIVEALLANDETADYEDLFDTGKAVAARFQALSERVTVENGNILLDGDVVDDSLTQQIVRFLDEGIEDWQPLVAFLENVAANPQDESKTQLYNWVTNQREGVTITKDGLIVGYKGVQSDGDGSFQSLNSGTATVQRPGEDPVTITGRIPNEVGSIVTMPRSQVVHDPAAHCHRGLHVGTQAYASSYGSVMLEVHVNPRDVVSVPNDAAGEKIRVCRYTIVKVLDAGFRYTGALRPDDEMEPLDDGYYAPQSGDRVIDDDGDVGTVVKVDGWIRVKFDDPTLGERDVLRVGDNDDGYLKPYEVDDELDDLDDEFYDDDDFLEDDDFLDKPQGGTTTFPVGTKHGRGGPTSEAAKGRGRNPAQDKNGRFSSGRPGSDRDSDTGKFSA